MNKIAIITGVGGQDGSYLAEFLLNKNYTVVGVYRRSSLNNLTRINHFINHPNLILEESDISDPSNTIELIDRYRPDEIYNLAAQSHVATSFKSPLATFSANTSGVVNLLDSCRLLSPATRIYQASTSEMFGSNYSVDSDGNKYQDENTALMPQSPYAVSKVASHQLIGLYRSGYEMYCCSGILFNHESPRRGENFVTRKITLWLGRFLKYCKDHDKSTEIGDYPKLRLGNIDAYRDWGHAKDYVQAMWKMLQQDSADDFVISTGETHKVKEFLELCFGKYNLDYNDYITIDPMLFRPAEVEYLKGSSAKAKRVLKWQPNISFSELVDDMLYHDVDKVCESCHV